MKITRWDGSETRAVLIGMITDPVVCSRIVGQWEKGGLFDSAWANIVAGWCVRYYGKYGVPPNSQLTSIFEEWAAKPTADADTVLSIEKFLFRLSNEHNNDDSQAADFIIDIAARLFNRVRMRSFVDALDTDLDGGYLEDAQVRIDQFRKVELGAGAILKPAEDPEFFSRAFNAERQRPLITYPGPLGRFFGDSLQRGAFYSFMGPDKSGKSFWLLELAYRALRQRRRVAYFDVGDNSEDDMAERIGSRVARLPLFKKTIEIPIGWDKDKNPVTKSRRCKALSDVSAFRAMKHLCRTGDVFNLSCMPNSTVSVAGLDTILEGWERDGWRPDVVVVDYADILAAPSGVKDTLDQIDETWKQLRRMSQERHCLVLTASQSNAAAYKINPGAVLGKSHFSGRKTKLAVVNGMIGINVSPLEKDMGVTRLNWVARRKGKTGKIVRVAGCLDIGRPAIISMF